MDIGDPPMLIRPVKTLLSTGVLALAGACAYGQTGQITGRATDPSGAVVPQAKVTVTQISTGVQHETRTNSDGYYTEPQLLPGLYTVAIEAPGFKPIQRTGVELQVDQDLRLDFVLELGNVSEKIVVTAQAPVLETETQSIGQVVGSRQVVELPLLGRNAYALGELVPGVRISRGMNDLPVDQISTSSVSINGAPGNANEFLLDGAPNTAAAQNQPIIYANADSVQEFKVQTNNYSAEYGRAAGGIFNVVTKSGSNDVHFTLYEFLRNTDLNSSNWFANLAGQAPPPLKFNQFGGVLGGPVVIPKVYDGHNKTFFFLSTELVRYIQGVTYTATVPDPVKLTGDFTHNLNSSGKSIVIYDPATTKLNAAHTAYVRTPFPGNVIPSNRINPVAAGIAKYWPAPNTPGALYTGANNYVRTDENSIQKNTYSVRVDQNFTDETRMFVRFSYDDTPWTRASPYGLDDPGSPGFGPQDFTRYNAVIEGDHIFSPTLIGTVRGSFSRLSNFRGPISQGFDMTTLGFPAWLAAAVGAPAAFPAIDISGYTVASSIPNNSRTGTLGETGLIAFGMNNYALQASVNKSAGTHALTAGGEFRVVQFNTLQTGDASDDFSFTAAFTQGPNPAQSSATGGDALATFLLGIPGGSNTPSPALAMQSRYYAAYVEDQWKVTSNLTLDLGLRYEYESPRTERFNQFTNFNYQAIPPLNAPALNLHGALSFVGVSGVNRSQANPDTNNFAPRLGFAYHVSPKTVLRAGGGLFYGTTWGIGGAPNSFGISGFTAATNIVTSLDGVTPVSFLNNPYPTGLNQATGSGLGAATLLGQNVTFYDRNNRTPYTAQWNFDVQRELPASVLLDVAYVGTRALKFPSDLQLNALPDAALALGNGLRTQAANPFYRQIGVGTLAASTVAEVQLLRPYPQFTGVDSAAADWATSDYHALQVKVEKRFAKGFSLLTSYTYSKLMDHTTGTFSGETLGGGAVQDWNNLKAEYSASSLDQTHRLIVNGIYTLPFFQAQHGIAGHLLGGWELGVVGSFYSGGPLGITSAVNTNFAQTSGQRPNWNGQNPGISDPTPYQWFDTSVFSAPGAYQYGTAPRTFNGARSDKTINYDLSLHKNTNLTERLALQFRAEAFNLTNTPVFSPPNTSYGAAGFGTVSSQANQPRIVQFGMKLIF